MKTHCLCFCVVFFLTAILSVSCTKKDPEDLIVGPWRMDGGDTVYTFRQNQGWISLKTKDASAEHGKEDGEGGGEKVEGQWSIDRPEGKKKMYLVITPKETVEGTPWKKEKPIEFEIVEITLKDLVLKRENGDVEKWKKQGKFSEDEKPIVPGVVTLPLNPVIVNLRRESDKEPYRFFCIKLDVILKNGDGLDYVMHEVNPENGKESYHIHPRINDVTLMHFSALYYKDVKTLDRVKVAVDQYKSVLQPYFKGKLMDVGVSKVVVTAKAESVKEFKEGPPADETEEKAAAGTDSHGGEGDGAEKVEGEGHGEKNSHGEGEQKASGSEQGSTENSHDKEGGADHGAEKEHDGGDTSHEASQGSH